MKNRKSFTACVLAAAVFAVNTVTPSIPVTAKGDVEEVWENGLTEEEIDEATAAADGVEVLELPKEDGEYIVYMEADKAGDIAIEGEVVETAEEAPEVILETDLSAAEVEELEVLSSQSEEVYIEENFFLDGASADFDPDTDIEDADYSFLEDMSAMERYNWKRAFVDQHLANEEEAEWNIQMVHADGQAEEYTGEPVKVAVMDSGVEFLAGFPVEKSVNLVKDEQEYAYYMNDMTGHGTAVADIIHRICPQAQIYSVKVLDSDNRGRLGDIVAGIYWCIEQDVDIINMSFGTSVKSDILEKAIQAAKEQGILMVSSAGNGGTGSAVEYPAAFEEVIAVGAVDTGAEKTSESATGCEVEIAAPGEQIAAKSLLGFDTVNSGTSMAAPHVTGAAALLMQQSEYKDADFIRRILQKSSNPLGDEEYYGSGLLDVAYAKELLHAYEDVVMSEQQEDNTNGEIFIESAGEASEKETEHAGDALEMVEQTAKPVDTFEEIDYVEGRWGTSDHGNVAEEMGKDYGLSATGIKLFKAGAMYSDQKGHDMHDGRGYWHGIHTSNYIANYIFVTQAALKGGDLTDLARTSGVKKDIYKDIIDNMNETSLFGRKWTTIMKEDVGLSGYTGQKRWRQIFIYGLALHLATDAFAHSSCYMADDGKVYFYRHSKKMPDYDKDHQADTIDHTKNRWLCARNTANYVASNCCFKIEGDVLDFSSYGENCWKGFYMFRIGEFARKADQYNVDLQELQRYFQAVDCFDKKHGSNELEGWEGL